MNDSAVGCPLTTSLPHSWGEHSGPGSQLPDIRAYKLGKKRWSYNQVELVLGEAKGGARTASVRQVVHAEGTKFHQAHQDSAVAFHVELESGAKLQAQIFLCYDRPPFNPRSGSSSGGSASSSDSGSAAVAGSDHHAWHLVTRKDCCKKCEGRVLRSIQRFGRQGKRCRNGDAKPAAAPEGDAAGSSASAAPVSSKKDPKFMYLSLDEACTHVDASAFRLVAGIYNRQGTRLLATSVSPPIRVLANNDVPTGAARIKLEAHLPADWEGWSPQAPRPASSRPLTTSRPRKPSTQSARPKPIKTESANVTSGTAMLPSLPLRANPVPSLSVNPSSKEVFPQRPARRQAVQQQQFSELSSFDAWQLPASSLASKLPQPARSREASGHLVSGGSPLSPAAGAIDYSIEGSTTLTSFPTAAPHGCPEPPNHWLAPAGLAELASKAGSFVPAVDEAAQLEAGRQLNLLHQLKAGLLAASNQEASTGYDSVPAASPVPVAWTSVAPAVPHLAAPLNDGCSALAACWEQEVAHLQASSSLEASASFVMPRWQPTSHCPMPAVDSLLMDSFALGMPSSKHCDFGAANQDLEDQLHMMLPSHHDLPRIEMLDIDMVPLFPGDLIAGY
ncbi:hypothetical protein D9Q98_005751 [Chlorella vulgaris]|uniref:Uncharacterized protein n=1 Tax=Chlorella vulgaris TaxID=3077 RepID=A0A9D4YW84_CHLVU|nr:hypothetical protein D9Q98_005751 [Chlorella vulgaris]